MEKVLVTGCSSGFGLNTVITLASHGYEVIATVRDTSNLTLLKQRIQSENLNERIHIEFLDVLDAIDKKEKVIALQQKYGGFDVVVLNAGILYAGLCEEVSIENMNKMVQTNLTANMALVSMLLPTMKERKKGKLIFISSLAARRPLPYLSSYNASKAGISAYAKSLYLELALFNIAVHLVEPGFYQTELWHHKIICQDDYSKKLHKISFSVKNGRPMEEVTFQILKICQGRKKGLHSIFGLTSLFQTLFSSLLYTKLGKKAYLWLISK